MVSGGNLTRADGGKITAKQMAALTKAVAREEAKTENPDFDPRKHRIPNGIRPEATPSFF